jgi:hypothetical protein
MGTASDRTHVWRPESDGTEYHTLRSTDGQTTYCGIDVTAAEARRFERPGDGLEHCPECAERTVDMSNAELVEWLADEERADFEADTDNAPSFLNKTALQSIAEYIIRLEEQQPEK